MDALLTGIGRAALRRLKTSEISFDRRDAIAAVQKDIEEGK
jgi:hypothetical protein